MTMRFPYVVERVERAGGFRSSAEAEQAIRATMEVLGDRLPAIDAEPLADTLPPELGEPLERGSHGEDLGAEELYHRVAEREGISVGIAREHVQVVCRELAEILTGEAREHLTLHVSPDVAELFEPGRDWGDPPARPRPRPRRTRTISEAGAESKRPLSESRPRGQTHSVAESENPHGDSKISTGQTSAEEEGRTLSRGKHGSKRPLSDNDA